MLAPDQALAFLLAALLVTASPGPDNLMVLSLGAARGPRAGVAFGLGCALGCLSHTAWAALGVSALLVAAPPAFEALRWAGGAYLLWLGVQAWRGAGLTADALVPQPGSPWAQASGRLFLRGLLANAVNPKVILFFLAFLPQFVRPEQGSVQSQLVGLGLVFTAQAALLFGLLGYAAGAVGARLQRWPRLSVGLDRAAGLVFVALGLRLIVGR